MQDITFFVTVTCLSVFERQFPVKKAWSIPVTKKEVWPPVPVSPTAPPSAPVNKLWPLCLSVSLKQPWHVISAIPEGLCVNGDVAPVTVNTSRGGVASVSVNLTGTGHDLCILYVILNQEVVASVPVSPSKL